MNKTMGTNNKLMIIDGSLLEGGGQILRLALSFSALTQTPIRVTKIRAGRGKPGLMDQHLKGVRLIADICGGRLSGDRLGSTEIELWPNRIKGGNYRAEISTAGAITLLLQTALPVILFSDIDSTLNLKGGTNTFMAPQIDYTIDVFAKYLELFGCTDTNFRIIKRSFFPLGGGHVEVTVRPVCNLNKVNIIDFGDLKGLKFTGSCIISNMPDNIGKKVDDIVYNKLNTLGYVSAWDDWGETDSTKFINTYRLKPYEGNGTSFCTIITGITSTGYHFGGSSIGTKNDKAEDKAMQAAQEIVKTIEERACLDQHCQDQVIIFMALADGTSKIRVGEVTMHTKTAIYICELMTKAKFTITPDGKNSIIECVGIGYRKR